MLFSLSVGQTAHAAQIYKWTDSKGVTHFSDSPPPSQASGQEKIALPDIKAPAPEPQYGDSQQIDEPVAAATSSAESTLAPQTEATEATDATDATDKKTSTKAEQQEETITVTLANLQDDQTIRSSRGYITVQGELSRKLGIGEALQLMMDTQPYGAPQTQALWELQNIDRGTHTFSINVVESGKVIASSKTITVHLHRTTVK